MKRILALGLLFCLLFLSGCGAGESRTTTDASDSAMDVVTTTAEPKSVIHLLDSENKPLYSVIRSEETDDAMLDLSQTAFRELSDRAGTTFAFGTDFKRKTDEVEDLYEILVGPTNREASALLEGLAVNEYIIAVSGHKIVLGGGGYAATLQAIREFLSFLDDSLRWEVEDGWMKKDELSLGRYLVGVTNQGESCVEVYDIEKGIDRTACLFRASMPYYNIADVKLRRSASYGEVVLSVCGNNYACMMTYPAGEVVWKTMSAADNPHSIELLPCGYIAVASSDGSAVRFFNASEKNSQKYTEVKLADAHAVLWDEKNEVLWALGRNLLVAYTVTPSGEGVTVEEVKRYQAPADWGHDLAPIYGNVDALWVVLGDRICRFNKLTGEFTTDYEGSLHFDLPGAKSVGNFPDGAGVVCTPDGAFKSWTTQWVTFIYHDGAYRTKQYRSSTGHFYKSRVWCADYQ